MKAAADGERLDAASVYGSHASSATPAAKTPSGIQKCGSPTRATQRERVGLTNARAYPRLSWLAMAELPLAAVAQ